MGFAFVQVWNVVGVLNYLQALNEKSVNLQILNKEKNVNFTFTATDGYDYYGVTNVLKVLGYFSIAGLLHVHCLLGDYQSGLCSLSPIDINQPGVFNTVIECQITTIYYYVFADLMLRRCSCSTIVFMQSFGDCLFT
jgi:translation initiation factor 3 subunit L